MAMHERNRIRRVWALGAVFLAVCLAYIIYLATLELSSENIHGHKQDGTTERTVVVQAVRGQIYDRNGVPLVTNAYTYNLTVDYSVLPTESSLRNKTILTALHMLEDCGEVNRFCTYNFPLSGYYPNYTYSEAAGEEDGAIRKTFLSVAENNGLRYEAIRRLKSEEHMNTAEANAFYKEHPLESISAERLTRYFIEEYNLLATDESGKRLWGNADVDRLIRILWGMEASGFSRANDYVMAENVTMDTITHEKELGLAGIGFATEATRVYNYPGYASHILGQTGPIYAEEWEYYKDLGYAMNVLIGKSGCEAAFESYLHGQDGVKVIVEDQNGVIVNEYMKTEAVAGQDIYLTIDIELQMAAEEALAENIRLIRTSYSRSECRTGAIVAMDPNNGEILALASYPTYDLATYNRDYATLEADEDRPLLNRALLGVYAPGSTFKPGMVAAALSEGIVTADTKLECAGTYTYYQSYQPDCWVHNSASSPIKQHGWLDAATALEVSCNCYFYETGRLLGIDRMNRYCTAYGLGRPTGIELGESVGSLAGPEHRNEIHGLEWQPTDTIAAAIGQSDNAFTPLQLGVYLSTLVNGGNRYAAHLLLRARDFATRTDTYVSAPVVVDSVPLSDAHLSTIFAGMERVISSSNTISYYMRNVPVTVAGKTGTAQTGSATDNGLFVCCAPSRNPEIVIASVIENAGGGSYSAMSAGELLAAYYKD